MDFIIDEFYDPVEHATWAAKRGKIMREYVELEDQLLALNNWMIFWVRISNFGVRSADLNKKLKWFLIALLYFVLHFFFKSDLIFPVLLG